MIRKLLVAAVLGCATIPASAQTPAPAPADAFKRLQAFITLLTAACTPELTELARKGSQACALIWYGLDESASKTRLPNALARTGYRPVTAYTPSADGDPLNGIIKIAHPQDGLISEKPVRELASGMVIEYSVPGSETLRYHYTVIGVVFPALCKAYPDKCGMKTYKDRVFDLREYKQSTFEEIAPRLPGDGISSLPGSGAGSLPGAIRP